MDPSQPSKNKKPTKTTIRRMGMSLSVAGAIVLAVGWAALMRDSSDTSMTRDVLVLAFGIALFATGLYIWRKAKEID